MWLSGILLAASIAVAVGVAIYENQQIQQWVENTRRKILVALQSDHDDPLPPPPPPRPSKDEQEAAVEAARQKRDEIMERNRHLFLRRRQQPIPQEQPPKAETFDGFLKGDGSGAYSLHSSPIEPVTATQEARSISANESTNEQQQEGGMDRGSPATLGREPRSHHPTTLIAIDSLPISRASSVIVATPTSSVAEDDVLNPYLDLERHSSRPYFSVNEWAESSVPSFYASPDPEPQVDRAGLPVGSRPLAPSLPDSIEDLGAEDSEARSDIISVTSGMHTPGTWTEVGSEVSEGDIGSH